MFDALVARLSIHFKYICDEIEVLDTSEIFVEVGVIGDIGKSAFAGDGVTAHVNAVNENFARIEVVDTCDAFERGGFPCAVVSDKRIEVAWSDTQVQVGYAFGTAFVVLGEMVDG